MRRHIIKSWHRFYDPQIGRYLNADPIGLAGGINMFVYVGGGPVNRVDPTGLGYILIGTEKEKAILQSWLDALEECAKKCDEIAKRLEIVKKHDVDIPIQFLDGLFAGGFNWGHNFLPNGVRIQNTIKDPGQKSDKYSVERSLLDRLLGGGDPRRVGYFRGPDVLAHELLGHGYRFLTDDDIGNETDARNIGNIIRKCHKDKQPQRSY